MGIMCSSVTFGGKGFNYNKTHIKSLAEIDHFEPGTVDIFGRQGARITLIALDAQSPTHKDGQNEQANHKRNMNHGCFEMIHGRPTSSPD